MSVPPPAGPPEPKPVPVTVGGTRRPVTLPTWVNVVLVLTLFVSCGANRDTSSYPQTDEIANQVVNQLQNGTDGSGTVSGADVRDLCKMLGAVLDAQKKKVDDVIPGAVTQCADAARQAANP
ncbi:hypothetical protein [Pedococcus sp. 2YAF34]|uniref:hypothetical protein n=1 Tax=Pedococcus sp. 2YAF34 TaxID=3233032 RepID=UPI003F97F1CD